jgi:hypothetical protein
MTIRRILFSLSAVVVLSGAVMAGPPNSSLPEGRELDPVARDYFLAPPAASEEKSSNTRSPEKQSDTAAGEFVSWLYNTINTWLTIPLGTVEPHVTR